MSRPKPTGFPPESEELPSAVVDNHTHFPLRAEDTAPFGPSADGWIARRWIGTRNSTTRRPRASVRQRSTPSGPGSPGGKSAMSNRMPAISLGQRARR